MAKHRRESPLGLTTRPVAWSAAISAAVLTAFAGPAYAAPTEPAGTQVPDAGSRPVPAGALQLPGGGTVPAVVPQLSTLAQKITAAETELETIGEQLKQTNINRAGARTNLALADRAWREATVRLKTAEQRAAADAAKAYKESAGLPDNLNNPDVRGFGALAPVPDVDIPGPGAAHELQNAQVDERAKFQAYSEMIKAEQGLATQYLSMQASYKQKEAALLKFKQDNADELAAIEREREAREQGLGAQYIGNGSSNGYSAAPEAMDAVRMALKQLGDPYVWGAEGPNTFDCSGLMWYSSYHYGAGRDLPRVSRDQYNGTKSKTVSRYALLPGDLLFFATNPNDWQTVHHVGMYLGGGKMIHAPTTGDVVKISTVWWSEFFAATRVFGEVSSSSSGGGPSGGGSTGGGSTGDGSTGGGSNGGGSTGGGSTPSPTPTPSQTSRPPASPSTSPSPRPPSSSPPSSPSPSPSDSPSPSVPPSSGGSDSGATETPSPTPGPSSPAADASASESASPSTSSTS